MADLAQPRIGLIRALMVFVLLGPLVVSIPIGLVAGLGSGHPGMSLAIVAFGYLIGFVPALLSGFVFYLLAGRYGYKLQNRRRRVGVGLGAMAGAVSGLLMATLMHAAVSTAGIASVTALAVFCVVSGALCGLFALPPNNSFKPKPLRGSA